jgi:uncharacterized membrane protein
MVKSVNKNQQHNLFISRERLSFLIDGVYAITLTLLVLELKPPDVTAADLVAGLFNLLPRLFVYLIAFYSVANYWLVHQHAFRHITKINSAMAWLLILGLVFITLMPATTAIFGRFPEQPIAIALFSVNNFFQAFVSYLFWAYSTKHHHQVASRSDPQWLTINAQVWLLISFSWLAAMALIFINPLATYASWIVLPNLIALWASRKRRTLTPV